MLGPIVVIAILIIGFFYSFFYLPTGTMRDIAISAIPLFIGLYGYTIKDYINDWNEARAAKRIQTEVISNLKKYFPNYLQTDIKVLNLGTESDEIKILTELLRSNFPKNDNSFITGCILCYYCKKWTETKNVHDFNKIKQFADILGVKNLNISDELKCFLEVYLHVIQPKEIVENDPEKLLKHFIEHYYKEMYLYDLTKEFNQTKNLHDTLKQLIISGKFSTYGITQETLKKIKKEVGRRSIHEKTFIVLHDGASTQLKDYLRSLPGLTGSTPVVRNIDFNAKYGMFIVKPPNIKTSHEFVETIKKYCENNSEVIIRVIPLDFTTDQVFTIPPNRSFTNEKMLSCYNAIEWFKQGYESEDSLIWNEIAKSSVTLNELASIIPFNIFCPGILESERIFLVTHYDAIKEKLSVSTLNEWKNIDPNLLAKYLFNEGVPDYNQEEMNHLKIRSDPEKMDAAKKRFDELAHQIVSGAAKVDEAIR